MSSVTAPHPFQRLRIVLKRVWDKRYSHDDEVWSRLDDCFSPNMLLEAFRGIEFALPSDEGGGYISATVEGLKERLVISQEGGLLRFRQD